MSFLIFDIETIPDTSVWTVPGDGSENTEASGTPPDIAPAPKRKRTTKRDVFPPLYAHRVIAIGVVQLDDALNLQGMGVYGTSAFGEDEKALLTTFHGYVTSVMPTIVTFNGRGFDLPVLALRSFRHGLSMAWYDKERRHRYGEEHIDILDVLTEHGAVERRGCSLDAISTLLGLPAKGEFDGSKVYDAWKKKQIQKIEGYCLVDTLKSTFALMRYLLMRGRIDIGAYRTAAGALLQRCTEAAMTGVTFGADPARLLLQD